MSKSKSQNDEEIENIRLRQENEVTALKSIYAQNCIDLREQQQQQQQTRARKSSANEQTNNDDSYLPPSLRFILCPQNSQSQTNLNQQYVQVEFKVVYSKNYPNEIPKFILENPKGLSNEQMKELRRQLIQVAEANIGQEMIYELCQKIEEYLYLNNKPPTKSFYDQMCQNEQEKQQNDQLLDTDEHLLPKKMIQDNELDEIKAGILERQRMIKEQMKKERQLNKQERLSFSNNSPSRPQKLSTNSKSNSESDNNETQAVQFNAFKISFSEPSKRTVNCIKQVRQERDHCFKVYRAIDIETNDMLNVYEWCISLEKNKIFEKKKFELCLTKIEKIEDEVRKFIKINNESLVKYLAYKHFKQSDKNNFIVQICVDYVEGNTFELFIKQKHALCSNTLRIYAIELLKILEYLHASHIFHRDLKASSVYIECNGNIRLADYSIVKRVNNLYESVVDEAATSLTNNAKTDIHQLGLLLLSLALGEQINEYYPKLPSHLPHDLRNFLSICINDNAQRQIEKFDCKTLRNHAFLVNNNESNTDHSTNYNLNNINTYKSQRRSSIHSHDEDDYDDDDEIDDDVYDEKKKKIVNIDKFTDYSAKSRLKTEFEVISVIGRGGFGEVLKVRNLIDKRYYAIKRIQMNPNSKQLNKKITREIKLLSRLNHENVVRYYSTWFEKYEDDSSNSNNNNSSSYTNTPTGNKKQQLLQKSSSFSDLVLKTANLNDNYLAQQTVNIENNNNDDGFSISLSSFKSSDSTDSSSSDSSESSSSSTASSSSSSSTSDDDDDDDFIKIGGDRKNVLFELSPTQVRKSTKNNNKKGNNNKNENNNNKTNKSKNKSKFVKDDDSDSVIFETDEANKEKQVKKKDNNDGDDDEDTEKMMYKQKKDNPSPQTKTYRQYIFIQMELCNGKTLKDVIDKELYKDVGRVWCLFREILQGLNHIHEQGMIHRDLKPRNVLIDSRGHAKIGDFGLATSSFFVHSDNSSQQNVPSASSDSTMATDGAGCKDSLQLHRYSASLSSRHNIDSQSLSGAVGTALYVAPELITPNGINKYSYTQKVDIYSLGIVFYEMCFPFSTNMERVYVLQNLRKPEILFQPEIIDNKTTYKEQIELIKNMLNHDPTKRPTAKELLRSDSIPRKADEIAIDELLKYSLSNKNSTNYSKIVKAVFDQTNPKLETATYGVENCKPVNKFYLQIRQHVFNVFSSIFQRNGAFMISYPLLMPWNDLCNDCSNKTFKIVDASGLILTLPYNHRVQFARYVAQTSCNNLKRYYIGNVYRFNLLNCFHPKESMEASYDVVTTSGASLLPEIDVLCVLNEILMAFNELADHEFVLMINHSLLLNSILLNMGIKQDDNTYKQIYSILSEYNKQMKHQELFKDNQSANPANAANINTNVKNVNWLKDELTKIGLSDGTMNKLVNMLVKSGTIEEVISSLRIKHESSQASKLIKEAVSQLKLLAQYLKLFDSKYLKYKIYASVSFVLPPTQHPLEYSGIIYQLLVRKKKKKCEYGTLASGGRYDKLVRYFCTKETAHYAVGISIDFDQLSALIFDKYKKNDNFVTYNKNQLAIFSQTSHNSSQSLAITNNNYNANTITSQTKTNLGTRSTGSSAISNDDNEKRLKLFHLLYQMTKQLPLCTYLIHEKCLTIEDMDNYCKKNLINSYAYFKDDETNEPTNNTNNQIANKADFSSFHIRTLVQVTQDKYKFIDKICNKNDFIGVAISNTNPTVSNYTTQTSLLSKSGLSSNNANISASTQNLTSLNQTNVNPYYCYDPSIITSATLPITSTSSLPSSTSSQIMQPQPLTTALNQSTSINQTTTQTLSGSLPSAASLTTSSNSNLSVLSQLNLTLLLEPSSRSYQISSGSTSNASNINRKKLESQIISRINHVFSLFSSRTRIELIAIETPELVIQTLANGLHLDCDEQTFNQNWLQLIDKLNVKYKKQLINFRLEEILRDLRYQRKSKVFIFYSLKSEQYKVVVTP